MRLTNKSQYGLIVLAELVRCYKPEGSAYRQLSELSAITNTSTKYLEQILLPLTHDGIVESKRGANGGYRLRVDPETVCLDQVLRLLDGRLMPIPRWIEEATQSQNPQALTAFGGVIYQIRDSIRTILETNSLTVLRGSGEDPDDVSRIREEVEALTYHI